MSDRILIMAHTEVQLRIFLNCHGIPKDRVRRIMQEHDIFGISRHRPILLLPGYHRAQHRVDRTLIIWRQLGGRVIDIDEEMVLGKAALPKGLCLNDTDGDGDCHLCARKGGCPNR